MAGKCMIAASQGKIYFDCVLDLPKKEECIEVDLGLTDKKYCQYWIPSEDNCGSDEEEHF